MRSRIVLLVCILFVAGCGEEFTVGVVTGAAGMKAVSDDTQDRFIEAINTLNEETTRINNEIEAVKDIDVEAFIKPEMVAAIESLKGREKDPTWWIALASALLSGSGVNIFKNWRKG